MDVKRIVIKGVMVRIDDHSHEEKFTLTPNSISFKCKHEVVTSLKEDLEWESQQMRGRDENDLEVVEWKRIQWARHANWSYKTNHPDFLEDFKKISRIVRDVIENNRDIDRVPEYEGYDYYQFALTFEDGRKMAKTIFAREEFFKDCFSFVYRWVPQAESGYRRSPAYYFGSAFSSQMKVYMEDDEEEED